MRPSDCNAGLGGAPGQDDGLAQRASWRDRFCGIRRITTVKLAVVT